MGSERNKEWEKSTEGRKNWDVGQGGNGEEEGRKKIWGIERVHESVAAYMLCKHMIDN